VFGSGNKLIQGGLKKLYPLHIVRIDDVDKAGKCSPCVEALTDKSEIQSVWYPGNGFDSIEVQSPLFNKVEVLQVREFGPMFNKIEHNMTMYKSMWWSKECSDSYSKDTPVKENKWVNSRRIKHYFSSVKRCWKSIASSKVKSTCWLIINHSLPVASRVHRDLVTVCSICEGKNVDHTHVFESCSRAKEVWKGVNEGLQAVYNVEIEASFSDVLNPGQLDGPGGKIIDAVAGITAHELWLDYCSYTHGRGELPPADKLSNAILAHFRLTLMSELSLLRSDLVWWERKFIFKPYLEGEESVRETLLHLKIQDKHF
jgi:hypothetical protein